MAGAIGRTVAVVLVLTALAACSSTMGPKPETGSTGDDTEAGLVARDYVRAIAVGQGKGEALLGKAYALLLPAQRAAIDETFYTGCILQEDNQGNDRLAEVEKVVDNGDVVPSGYSDPLPTKTVFVTLPDGYENAAEWYGKLRVSKDAGRWYVSVAAPNFRKYTEGNCEHTIWEYPEPDLNAPLPTAVKVPAPAAP